MPNKPRPDNRARPVRVEDEMWSEVQGLAKEDDVSASAIVREALRRYIKLRKRRRNV